MTKLDAGVADGDKPPELNKQSALREMKAVSDAVGGIAAVGKKDASAILEGLARLEADPALLNALQRRSLIDKGLELVEGPTCPLCDFSRQHRRYRLGKPTPAM